MALSEAEELELLQLEEDEAQGGGQTPSQPQMPAKATPPESTKRKFLRGTAEALPFVGGLAGEAAGGPLGAGLGAAAGMGYKQLVLRGLKAETPGQFFTDPTIGPSAGEAAKEMAIAGGTAAATSGVFRGVGKGVKLLKNTITKPGAAEARVLTQEALQDIAAKGGDEMMGLREAAGGAKKALISAEEKAGLHFRTSPKFEQAVANPKVVARVTESATRLADKGAKQIAETLEPKEIQSLRKFLQEAEKQTGLSDIAKSEMKRAKGELVKALQIKKPEIVTPLDELQQSEKAVREFPKVLRERMSSQRLQGAKDVLEGAKYDKRRRVLKALATAGAAGTGLGIFLK